MSRIDRSQPVRPFDRRARHLKSLRWYVFRVMAQQERRAEAAFRAAGFAAFTPTEELWRWRSRQAKIRREKKDRYLRPLMPGYVFAGFADGEEIPWGLLPWLDAVKGPAPKDAERGAERPMIAAQADYAGQVIRSVVSQNGLPCEVPFRRLAPFAKQSATPIIHAPGEHRYMKTHEEFGVGDIARVMWGPFEGHEMEVTGFTDAGARLKTALFGKETVQEFPLYQLEAAA